MSNGWIGVDLDGTLAEYHGWVSVEHIGEPVPLMLERVKQWRSQGVDVRIFTARYDECDDAAIAAIQRWCLKHIGEVLPITCKKDYGMVELWDDRAVQVEPNTGKTLTAEIDTLKAALSGRTVSCELCNTTSKENERLQAEVEHYKMQAEQASENNATLRTHLKAVHAGRGSQCYDESEMYAEQEGRGNDIPQ